MKINVWSATTRRPRADLASALDLALSFDAWRRLRDDQGLSREVAERVMRRMARALIASTPHS